MKNWIVSGSATLLLATAVGPVRAQVAGSSIIGVEVTELKDVALGWSAKKQILGRNVFNEKGEKVGRVEDLIVAPDKALSYAIIGAGGFVGLGRHDVAIPVVQFHLREGKLVLQGASKELIKALPTFEYATGK